MNTLIYNHVDVLIRGEPAQRNHWDTGGECESS